METRKNLTYFNVNIIWNTIDILVSYSIRIKVFNLAKEYSIF